MRVQCRLNSTLVVEIFWVTGFGRSPRAAPHGQDLEFHIIFLMFCARTSSNRYKCSCILLISTLVCASPFGSLAVRQTEQLPN